MNLKLFRRRPIKLLACAVKRTLRSRYDEGTALVEFAVVIPGLMIVLTGVLSFGMAFYSYYRGAPQ